MLKQYSFQKTTVVSFNCGWAMGDFFNQFKEGLIASYENEYGLDWFVNLFFIYKYEE